MILATLTIGMVATGAVSARAQSEDYPVKAGFVAVYGGAQPQRRTLTATQTLPLYDETATITSILHVRNAAMIAATTGTPVRWAKSTVSMSSRWFRMRPSRKSNTR